MWRNAAKCGAFLAHFGPIRAILGCFEMRRNAADDPNAAHFGAFRRHARLSATRKTCPPAVQNFSGEFTTAAASSGVAGRAAGPAPYTPSKPYALYVL